MSDAQCKRHFALRPAGCCKATSIDVREFESWDSGKRLTSPVDHGKFVLPVSFRFVFSSNFNSSNPARTHARGKVKPFIAKKSLWLERFPDHRVSDVDGEFPVVSGFADAGL